jgi:hypothetical protein
MKPKSARAAPSAFCRAPAAAASVGDGAARAGPAQIRPRLSLLGHWATLTAHLRHSHTPLDTNAVENAIRPSKLGAKNWFSIGHPDAGDRAAALYSLVVSCQRRSHGPHAYLRDVLGRLPAMTTDDNLASLLPCRWQPRQISLS